MACLHKCSFNLLVFRCTDTSTYWVQTELVCTTQDNIRNFKMINIRKILCSCQRQEAAGTQTALCPFSEQHSGGSRTQCHTRPTQPAVTILTLSAVQTPQCFSMDLNQTGQLGLNHRHGQEGLALCPVIGVGSVGR